MRDRMLRKMKDCAAEWIEMKRTQAGMKKKRDEQTMQGYNLNPMKPLPGFHDFFFGKFEEEYAAFDKHTRRFLFHLLYTNLETWEAEGLCAWETYRLVLTPEGENSLGEAAG